MGFNRRLVFTGCYGVSLCPMLVCFHYLQYHSGTTVVDWSVWICVDESWTTPRPLDCTHDLLKFDCHCKCNEPATVFSLRSITDYLCLLKYAIYMATVDYMIASYGPYAASATGGNGFARDFLAGIAAMYSLPSRFAEVSSRISTNDIQCISIWAQNTNWNGHPHFWALWLSFSPFRSTFSTGKAPGSENCRPSRRPWLPTGRRLVAGCRLVVPATQTLSSDICHRDLTCRRDLPLILIMGVIRLQD